MKENKTKIDQKLNGRSLVGVWKGFWCFQEDLGEVVVGESRNSSEIWVKMF
jgi:hypothetical protein